MVDTTVTARRYTASASNRVNSTRFSAPAANRGGTIGKGNRSRGTIDMD